MQSLLSRVLFFFFFSSCFASGQNNTTPKWHGAPVPQELNGGFWRVDHTFESKLNLKNVVELAPVTVTPVLYMADGTKYSLRPVQLEAAGVATVSINAALESMPFPMRGHLSDFGSVSLLYQWPWGGAITASVQNLDAMRSLVFNSSLIPITASRSNSASSKPAPATIQHKFEGLWWKHDEDVGGFLSLSNSSSSVIEVKIEVFASIGPVSEKRIGLAPLTTTILDLTSIIGDLPRPRNNGGIRVSYTGPPNSVAVNGGLENAKEGYSARIPFIATGAETGKKTTQTYSSIGIMNGEQMMMGFPAGTMFSPYAILRNPGRKPLKVALTLDYMDMDTRKNNSVQLPEQHLAPNETRALDLKEMFRFARLPKMMENFNLSFTYESEAGGLVIATGAVDQTGTYVLGAIPKFVAPGPGRVICYWNLENRNDAMITVMNTIAQPEDLMLTFFYSGGEYKMPLHLEGRETSMLSLMEIVQKQVPDQDGHVIPLNVKEGSASIMGKDGERAVINAVVDAAVLNVRTATCRDMCQQCSGYTSVWNNPDPSALAVSDTLQMSATGQYSSGSQV